MAAMMRIRDRARIRYLLCVVSLRRCEPAEIRQGALNAHPSLLFLLVGQRRLRAGAVERDDIPPQRGRRTAELALRQLLEQIGIGVVGQTRYSPCRLTCPVSKSAFGKSNCRSVRSATAERYRVAACRKLCVKSSCASGVGASNASGLRGPIFGTIRTPRRGNEPGGRASHSRVRRPARNQRACTRTRTMPDSNCRRQARHLLWPIAAPGGVRLSRR